MNRAVLALLLLLPLTACTTTAPADYASTLSAKDKKWRSAQCKRMRTQAASYDARERDLYWSAGAVLGPYGLGIVAAGKEHQAKQRRRFMRDMHLKCSGQPLPPALANIGPG